MGSVGEIEWMAENLIVFVDPHRPRPRRSDAIASRKEPQNAFIGTVFPVVHWNLASSALSLSLSLSREYLMANLML